MTYEYDKKMAAAIRDIRATQGMTQEQLAARLQIVGIDITRGTLANIESGRRHIFSHEIKAFKEVFNCSYDDLFV